MMRTSQKLALTMIGAALYLNAQIPDFTPPTPLFGAIFRNDTARVKQLLAEGADPNDGRFLSFTPLMIAASYQNAEIVRALVEKGADFNAADRTGSTVLMFAAYNEEGNKEIVEELIKRGADVNAKNAKGETALTWAMRRGYTPVVRALKEAGASDAEMIRESVEKAVALLQKSGAQFVKVSGCMSCHHQSLEQMAVSEARARGFHVDEAAAQQQVKAVTAMFKPVRELMLKGGDQIPNPPISVGYALLGLASQNYTPDPMTDAAAYLISTKQDADGKFRALPMRPPLEASQFTATALAIRALTDFGKDADEQIALARQWLKTAEPRTMEDRTMQVLGLVWSRAETEDVRKAAAALAAEQRPDGGWAQLPMIETDAYATGKALVALHSAGALTANDAAYQKGVGYLLRTQMGDGSWLVRTRTLPVQPYKESGFPHGKDQWISASGTSWAVMALSLTAPQRQELSRLGE